MKEKKNQQKYRSIKWIFLSISILLNGFIIFYSSVDEATTIKWNNALTNVITNIVNSFSKSEKKDVPLEDIEIKFSNETDHKYNYLPGYELNEIPLGSAKQIECVFSPGDATNKSVSYSVVPSDLAKLNQTGSLLSVVGMKTGTGQIIGTSKEGNKTKTIDISVVETTYPTEYEIFLSSNQIPLGKSGTINFDINGGNLGHKNIINNRYYDIRKLHYSSSNVSVATVNNYGVILPVAVGTSVISVSNDNGYSRQVNVEVISGGPSPAYSNLHISGSDFCYENDLIFDPTTESNHFQLSIFDNDTQLNAKDFIWESSNELLAQVDNKGVLRGFRKTVATDENVTITATSKVANEFHCSFDVLVKQELPKTMKYTVTIGDQDLWNLEEYTCVAGDQTKIVTYLVPNNLNKDIKAVSSDESVATINIEGNVAQVQFLKEGSVTITVSPLINESIGKSIKFVVLKEGSIKTSNLKGFGKKIRKTIGHALMFTVTEIFTAITLFMFLSNKKLWIVALCALGHSIFISSLSELIQLVEPTRHASFSDVGINLLGCAIGLILVFGIIFIIKYSKNRKNNKNPLMKPKHALSLDEIKSIEVDMLSYIDELCKKHSIKYSICGGTLLGAIRHKGFIPWDDDVDIFLLRKDYEKLLKVFSLEIHPRFKVISNVDKSYNYMYAKLYDSNTILKYKIGSRYEVKYGVFIDIFPIDDLANTEVEAKKNVKQILFGKSLITAGEWKKFFRAKNISFKRQFARFIFFVLSRFNNPKKTINKLNNKTSKFPKNSQIVATLYGRYTWKDIYDCSMFDEYIDVEFEGHKFKAIKQYDRYLTALYGDYMKLPPEEQRISDHSFIVYYKEEK